jgi:hypothetical protein
MKILKKEGKKARQGTHQADNPLMYPEFCLTYPGTIFLFVTTFCPRFLLLHFENKRKSVPQPQETLAAFGSDLL